MKQKLYIFFLFSVLSVSLYATHNRAGEITFRWISGYTYEIKIITYTNTNIIGGQQPADRCEDTLFFGDGNSAVVPRSNGSLNQLTNCGPAYDGEMIAPGIKKNIYITVHTYGGPGTYKMFMRDPNRNAGIINIPNSVNQPFYIESMLIIPQFSVKNSSPVLTISPIDNGCVYKCFIHNPGAYDPDGDSLSYELTTCRTYGGQTVPGYSYPSTGSGGYLNVNATNGNLTWCSPQLQGEYNLAMIIREWRKNDDGEWKNIGYVLRDLQVDIGNCNNNPPQIRQPNDTCVEAGTLLNLNIFAADTFPASQPDIVTLTANGGPFVCDAPIATFASVPSLGTVQGAFSWQTACVHIRKTPYQVTIKAQDNDPSVQLVDFKTFNITVVSPPPLNLIATPIGTYIKLIWQKPVCHITSGNKIARYYVYRKNDCTPWIHGYCETGVPSYTGFTYIGQTTGMNDTTFTDTNNGNGLIQGISYSYIVTAIFDDGAFSYASNQTCTQLKRDIPILVNVDVQSTGTSSGSVFVRWIKPLITAGNLDTTTTPGPYEFRLMHYDGFSGTFSQVYSVSQPYYAALHQLSDTTFVHQNTNTVSNAHTYKVEFYANGQFIGSCQKASSVYLSATPGDKKIKLSWQHQVPWTNYKYFIYKKDPSQSAFSLVDSTTHVYYTDSLLINGENYCYKVQSKGQYSDTTIFKPLLNFSQEVCASPIDLIPPCSPTLAIQSDCQVPIATLTWNNPNHVCCSDAVKYNIYLGEVEDEPLLLVDSIKNMNDTILVFDNSESIAGCYAVTAVDSFGNESALSTILCIDNCPEYELPNVVTINGDGVNDFFKAIKNRFVKDIDLKIYNRWGQLIYQATDPAFNWDGKVLQSKLLCSEGTYFYVCQVNEIRVKGITPRYLKGFVQVFHK